MRNDGSQGFRSSVIIHCNGKCSCRLSRKISMPVETSHIITKWRLNFLISKLPNSVHRDFAKVWMNILFFGRLKKIFKTLAISRSFSTICLPLRPHKTSGIKCKSQEHFKQRIIRCWECNTSCSYSGVAVIIILSHDWVIIYGFWIDNCIYWALLQLVTTLCTSLSHTD
jgi:hypothetical protein